jgi:hypothetical protein
LPKNCYHKTGPDDIKNNLVFFSTFEELVMPIKGPMEDAEVIKLYEPSPTHVVGRGKPRLGSLTVKETAARARKEAARE